ncbi:DUF1476 domain-containing protein [Jannaschia pohangensis]|uniref:Aldolase n=1 Tax=Jannaschia pohangensis TaxID=390807 RepID=A0A1I3I7A7_9RHOB|nr:DUF1476 domain-containing protein [Jannaschia pohangensis]SFI43740.1 hypothetical protein SAMN04488095_0842 [Jannaschia pohangensis]
MSNNFTDREKSFENKFAHDAELQFKVEARRNRLLGEWAGAQMGLEGDALKAYATEVVKSDFEEAGDDDVLRKVAGDLGDKSSREEIRAQMDTLMVTAKQQVMTELK